MAFTMKAITLTQPWASAIALGYKRIETRSWRTHYTGRIAIHAAKRFPAYAREFASTERTLGRMPARIPTGAVVAVATLVGCSMTEDVAGQLTVLERLYGDYTPGRWAWMLSDITALVEPVFCRGALGLWTIAPEIAVEVERQLQCARVGV